MRQAQVDKLNVPFWQNDWLWLLLAFASLVPFLAPSILPFTDLPNHIGRHAVFLEAEGSPFLQRYYSVQWMLAGNLGIDLIVRLIGPWLGAELATNCAVAITAPLGILGIWSLGRSLHGAVPPSAFLSALLIYNWPLLTGFTNFSLSAAIAINVLALWIRLRSLPFAARFLIFAPLGFVTWVAHTAGWGLLGLGVLTYEIARAAERKSPVALLLAPFQTAPFAVMFAVTLIWRTGSSAGAGIKWSSNLLKDKAISLISPFREYYMGWDLAVEALFVVLLGWLYLAGGRRINVAAAAIAIAYAIAFLACPPTLFNSGFADRRLLVYALMVLPLAVGVKSDAMPLPPQQLRLLNIAAVAALALFLARVAISTAVWSQASHSIEQRLALLDSVPRHSRILGLSVRSCKTQWARVGVLDSIQQLAIPRRHSVINGMFQNPGLNQVTALGETNSSGFNPNMYPWVGDRTCPLSYTPTLQATMHAFPRDRFDYVWIVSALKTSRYDTTGLQLVRAHGDDRLYRVVR